MESEPTEDIIAFFEVMNIHERIESRMSVQFRQWTQSLSALVNLIWGCFNLKKKKCPEGNISQDTSWLFLICRVFLRSLFHYEFFFILSDFQPDSLFVLWFALCNAIPGNIKNSHAERCFMRCIRAFCLVLSLYFSITHLPVPFNHVF